MARKKDRAQIISEFETNPEISVLVVGGGINGAGVYWDLALQGVNVLLVERSDFCSGASAASSHMAHGGIRYLENGEFRLVREAVKERNRLLINAPHYVKPLPTTIPVFKWFSGLLNAPLKFLGLLSKPSERGGVVIKIGLWLYELFSRSNAIMPYHEFRLRSKALRQFPKLNSKIVCTATYFDGSIFHPERLNYELIQDGSVLNDRANALNYVAVVGQDANQVWLKDEITGNKFCVEPSIVVNATGAWIDFSNEILGTKTEFIGGTKGSHLILDHPELHAAIQNHEFFFENKDGRIVLIYPYGKFVLVGTSDIPIRNLDQIYCTDVEIEYFFQMIKNIFPTIEPTNENIVFQFSGVRPLPKSDSNQAGQISRDHKIERLESNEWRNYPVLSLVGGKWTTFRAFAEKVSDMVLQMLNEPRIKSTSDLAIGGGVRYPVNVEDWTSKFSVEKNISLNRAEELFSRYGTYARNVVLFEDGRKETILQNHLGYSREEIEFILTNEQVLHLDDLVLRRTLLAKFGELSLPLIAELASIAGKVLGWAEPFRIQEIDRLIHILKNKHGVKFD